jgi:hypothetical protein
VGENALHLFLARTARNECNAARRASTAKCGPTARLNPLARPAGVYVSRLTIISNPRSCFNQKLRPVNKMARTPEVNREIAEMPRTSRRPHL